MNQAEVAAAFTAAVGSLTEDDRRALGLTTTEIERDVRGDALRKRKQRALDRLREVWRAGDGRP